MSEALEKAYASNTETPLVTLEFIHSSITTLRLVQAYQDITATLEDSTTVTFSAAAFGLSLPARSTDGRQDLTIQLDNVSETAYQAIKAVKAANRTTQEKMVCKYRPFLESNLNAPAGSTYTLTVANTVVTRNSVSITAVYTPIPDIAWPVNRYFVTNFPGLKYV